MPYAVRIYDKDRIHDVSFAKRHQYTIGTADDDDYQIAGGEFLSSQIQFFVKDGKWVVTGKKNVFFGGQPVTGNEIKSGDIYTLGIWEKLDLWVYEYGKTLIKKIDLTGIEEISIGRNKKNNIIFTDKRVSGSHVKIYKGEGSWRICDLASTNGTYVNGKQVSDAILQHGDKIGISVHTLLFSKNCLTIQCNGETDMEIQLNGGKSEEKGEEALYREYPYFSRSPRLKRELPQGEIEIEAPPSTGTSPEINWFGVLLPPIAMIAVMIGIVVLAEGSTMSLYYTAPMSLISILVSVTTYITQKRHHKKRTALRMEKYAEYIGGMIEEIETKQNLQREAQVLMNPSAAECFDIALEHRRRLWERCPTDKDFMDIRLGEGTSNFNMEIKIPKMALTLEDDALLDRPKELLNQYQLLDSTPVICQMSQTVTCGIIGSRTEALYLLKNMILHIISLHCYDEVKLVTVFSREEAEHFEWIKWLPHSFDDSREKRYMADDAASAVNLFRCMEDILSQREREVSEEHSDSGRERKLPHYLFILADKRLVEDQMIIRYLTSENRKMGISTIFLFDELSRLPKECELIIEVFQGQGLLYNKENITDKRAFTIENMNGNDFEALARKMLPVRIAFRAEEGMLPNCITFLEGYGVRRPQEINLDANWSSALTYKSMSVPIGVKANGEDFNFDIHEKAFGPHGLVAGMTGSGKSEMVQSWILSMALRFSPKDVSFVLIDFKGTGLILPFLKMPHLAGTISDLDTNINRNLIALEHELSRRKTLLDEAGVNNINAYLKSYKDGKVKDPLSFLFIVIDEFAEFKVQFPDFMTVINRIFAIGRTLGVFAILLTQKPAGVVDDKMHANTRFRWCLKVASSADSRDMLRHPDAAKITIPGRAYVQVGEDEVYELIQSYWSGAPYNPNQKRSSSAKPTIASLGIGGERFVPAVNEKSVIEKTETNEIDAVIDYLDEYVKEHQIPRAKKIWEPKMPTYIPLLYLLEDIFDGGNWPEGRQSLEPVIGLVDNPHSQSQYPLRLPITEEGHIVIYGAPGTGKTTLLQTIIMSVCMEYSPENVNVYAMDFGGWSLNIFRDYPHVGGIANDNEEEKIIKLARLISKEMEQRKVNFAQAGVGNINAYREATKEQLPYLLLLVDNFAPVFNLYPDLEDFFVSLTREGGNYGIYLIATAGNTMAMGFKMVQNIKMALTLQMTDRSDYTSIVGKTNGLEPENNEGRGLIKGTPPLEFQSALPAEGLDESERVNKIGAAANLMNKVWNGVRAKPIPVMPELIPYGSILEGIPAIGLSVEDIEPVRIDFTGIHYLLISGSPQSGKSNMLQVLVKQMKASEFIVFDSPNYGLSSLKDQCSTYLESGEAFDNFIDKLAPALQERREAYLQDETQKFPQVLIAVDDLKFCFDSISNETARRLEAIVRLGRGIGITLLVAGDCEDITSLYNQGEPFTIGLVKGPVSILLGGSFNEHGCFKSDLSYSEAGDILDEFEGYYVKKEKAIRFKAMCSR